MHNNSFKELHYIKSFKYIQWSAAWYRQDINTLKFSQAGKSYHCVYVCKKY